HLDPNLYHFVIIKSILGIPLDLAVKFKKVKNSSETRASKQLRQLFSNLLQFIVSVSRHEAVKPS
ncbi:hypothetical protein PanWU01x14_117120, partial [Parasponia andersonii]